MPRFDSLDQYLDPGLTLAVPGADKVERDYVIPLPSAELGLWCRRIAATVGDVTAATTDAEVAAVTDTAREKFGQLPKLPGEASFEQRLLGDAHAAMLADGVPDPYLQFAAQTVYVWITHGEDAAGLWWRSGGRPEAPGPGNRAQRRAAKHGGSSTDAASATNPGSTSGTKSRRRKGRKSTASASPGPTSSPTGS